MAVMSKTFELWDTTTNNLVEACDAEDDALAFVRAYVAEHGRQYPASWVLLWDDETVDLAGQIAEGSALLVRAGAAAPASQALPPVTPQPPR